MAQIHQVIRLLKCLLVCFSKLDRWHSLRRRSAWGKVIHPVHICHEARHSQTQEIKKQETLETHPRTCRGSRTIPVRTQTKLCTFFIRIASWMHATWTYVQMIRRVHDVEKLSLERRICGSLKSQIQLLPVDAGKLALPTCARVPKTL